jgi:Tfp pilus assembly protein PilE
MLSLIRSKNGLGMIEVIAAMLMTVVAVLAVFALVSPAWRSTAKADYLGRASGILYQELVRQEARIMNSCCSITSGTLAPTVVNASGQANAQSGDAQFNVSTTITNLSVNAWRVSVRVTWTGSPQNGISESMIVTRQDGFSFPTGCATGGTVCQ